MSSEGWNEFDRLNTLHSQEMKRIQKKKQNKSTRKFEPEEIKTLNEELRKISNLRILK